MHPHQVISLEDLPGETSFALPDHYDHVHIGYHPVAGGNPLETRFSPLLKPDQWQRPDRAPRPDRKPGSADQALGLLAAGLQAGKSRERRPQRRRIKSQARESRPLAKLFGFAQFDFAGPLPLADGRYLARTGAGGERESVLVVRTLGAPPPRSRRRRRPQRARPDAGPAPLPLARATAIRAFAPLESEAGAAALARRGDRGRGHGRRPRRRGDRAAQPGPARPRRRRRRSARPRADAASGRWRCGSATAAARRSPAGRFSAAREVDVWAGGASRAPAAPGGPASPGTGRRGARRAERIDACETLLLRARADLDAGRRREAALQLRVGLEALLVELREAVCRSRPRRRTWGRSQRAAGRDRRSGELGPAG